MMKGKSILILLAVAAVSTSAMAVELDLEASASVDIFDKYVWRGQQVGNKTVIQPSATIGQGAYSFNVWGNMPILKNDSSGKPWSFQELNYILDYAGSYDKFSYSGGFIIYDFPNTLNLTAHEIYGTVGYDTFLSPSLEIYKGTYKATGFYVKAAIEHSLELTETLALDLGSSLAWADNQYNKTYFGGAPAGFNDFVLSAALPIDVAGVPIVPSLSYVTLVDDKVRAGHGPKSDNWILGVGSAIEF
jgi:hypothetical protein